MPKLGSKKNPVMVRVATDERLEEIVSICKANNWHVLVEVNPDESEDITVLDQLLNPSVPIRVKEPIGRNDPCPCGSGKKFKKCCIQ